MNDTGNEESLSQLSEYSFYKFADNQKSYPPIKVKCNVNGQSVCMELDTGAGKSLINMDTYTKVGKPELCTSTVILKT